MQKKEFFGVLLLVSMVSSIMFAGFVSSNLGRQITVYPNSGNGDSEIEWIKGSGWTPNTLVTLYWDQQNLTHVIANVTADSFGKFKVQELEVEGSFIGVHTIIAVQGPTKVTALYTMKATTTPDDRILAPIQQLEDKLDNTTSGLPGIQANLTKIDNDVNAVEAKLDSSGRLGNTTQMASKNGFYKVAGTTGYIITCQASETAEFTVTYSAWSNVSSSDVYLALYNGTTWTSVSETSVPWNGYMYYLFATITLAAKGVQLAWTNPGPAVFTSDWFITVQAPPGATITFS